MTGTRRGWLWRLAVSSWQHRGPTLLSIVAAVLAVLFQVVIPLVAAKAVDSAVAGHLSGLGWLLGLIAVLELLTFGCAFVRRYFGAVTALKVQHDLRQQVFAAVQRLDGAKQDAVRTGEIVSRSAADLQLVHGLLTMVPLAVGSAVFTLTSLGVMLWLSPLLGLLVLAVIPVVAIAGARSRKVYFPATWSAQQSAAELTSQIEETVSGIRVVQGFGQETAEISRFTRLAGVVFGERMRVATLTAGPSATLAVIPLAGQVGVLAAGGWLALHGQVTTGTFLAFATYVTALVGPTRLLAGLMVNVQLARTGIERVHDLLQAQPEVTEKPDAADLPDGALELRLSAVRFGYTRDEPVLEGLSLVVRPGETVALVGSVGCGKSTVAMLLPRFYDVHGGVVSVGGVDVRELRLESLRQSIGMVFEESFLFADTVRANIAFGRPDATDEEVVAAARAAQAHEFIHALPHGYETQVGERGYTLSGGQRQRIALARALLTGSRVLVLDDATSALDVATEAALHDVLRVITENRTTLVIAHRRSSLALADRIVVLDRGRVADTGSHDELLARCVLYRDLLSGGGELIEQTGHDLDQLWPGDAQDTPASLRSQRRTMTRAVSGAVGNLPATPALRAAIDRLPAADERPPEVPAVDGFSVATLISMVRWPLAAAVLLALADSLLGIGLPTVVRHVIDDGVAIGRTDVLWASVGIGAMIVAAGWAVARTNAVVTARAGERLLHVLRVRSYAHLQRLGLDYFEREMAGRITTRLTTDVNAMANFLQTGVAATISGTLIVVAVLIALIVTDHVLALVVLACLPVLVLATVLFHRRSSVVHRQARERIAEVNAHLHENLAGKRTSQAYGRERHAADEFSQRSTAYLRTRMQAQRYLATYFPFVELFGGLLRGGVLLVGAQRVADGTTSPGTLLAFLLYTGLLFAPVQALSGVFDEGQQAAVGLRRIGDLLRTSSSVPVPEAPVAIPAQGLRGELQLRDVSYRYPGADEPAVTGLSLTVRPGETVAFVGSTGAGKSTLLRLLARFYDVSEGDIRVDGVDIRKYDPGALRRRFAVVPQEPYLFAGDVATNIAYARAGASHAEVEAAAQAVGAFEMIRRLPGGFRHQLGERGQGLSAGQRQLIGLARAALAEPDVLLLDEATAALDLTTENAVLAAIEQLSGKQRTTFLVAHRLATAAGADRIVMLAEGRVVEDGTHNELITRGGAYARLWRIGTGSQSAVSVGNSPPS